MADDVELVAERDAALLLAGEALMLLEYRPRECGGCGIIEYGRFGYADAHDPACIMHRLDAQAALAKWREQQ